MRAPLRGLAVGRDGRHPLPELDRRLLGWFRPTGKPVHFLLTKADKLSRAAAQNVLRRREGEIAALGPNISVQLFSSLKNSCLEGAAAGVATWLGPSAPPPCSAGDESPRPA